MELKARSNLCRKTQSWMVISRGAGQYVKELSEESKKSVHFEDASSSKGKLVAMEKKENNLDPSSSSTLPIRQRTWKDILSVPKVTDDNYHKISK